MIPREYSAFIFGPRMTGKSTVLENIPSLLKINLLDQETQLRFNINPTLLRNQIESLKEKKGIIIIDEIQKVPKLLDEVQSAIDSYPHLHFLLSGSSARKLKRNAANMLGGRALNLSLFPLSVEELGDTFNLETVLSYGSLPKVYTLMCAGQKELALDVLRSYCTTYLVEEIKEESIVRKLDGFQRFLASAAFHYASDINFESLAEHAQISAGSCKNYFSILEDTLIGFILYPYSHSIKKQLSKVPKFYFFDNGVTRALNSQLLDAPSHQERGKLFEQWVIQEVRKVNSYYKRDLSFYFWRTTSRAEVDLLVCRGSKILAAIEIKATPYPSQRDLTGLRSFLMEHPSVPSFLCAPVKEAMEFSLELNISDKVQVKKISVLDPVSLMNVIKEL